GTGGIAYDSVSGNDGTIYGAQWTTGQVGGALEFDGVNDYVEVPDDDSLDITGDLTIAAWVKLDALADEQFVLAKQPTDTADAYAIRIYEDGGVNFRFKISGMEYTSMFTPASIVTTGSWYHITATYNGSEGIIYVNGQPEGSELASGNLSTNDAELLIGREHPGCSNFLNGKIDDVRIYSRRANSGL
ncbi:unnamed protein product, partial [marine sediment metagenome]